MPSVLEARSVSDYRLGLAEAKTIMCGFGSKSGSLYCVLDLLLVLVGGQGRVRVACIIK